MTPLRHRICMSAFKCILSVIGAILFTAQLSYKFYQFASIPLSRSNGNRITHGQTIGQPGAIHDYDRNGKVFLSLDKRYDLKSIYYLPVPVFRLASLPLADYDEVYFFTPKAVSRPNLLSPLRGPPCPWL